MSSLQKVVFELFLGVDCLLQSYLTCLNTLSTTLEALTINTTTLTHFGFSLILQRRYTAFNTHSHFKPPKAFLTAMAQYSHNTNSFFTSKPSLGGLGAYPQE
ncbi:hypothetical protein HHE06_07390 [Helicobacter heilmannii]|nr:hypothetical protein HHE06_07390 [Helicobacter heilmannii]